MLVYNDSSWKDLLNMIVDVLSQISIVGEASSKIVSDFVTNF